MIFRISRSQSSAVVNRTWAADEAQLDAVKGLPTANRYVVPGVSA